MHFRKGLQDWWSGLKKVEEEMRGIERVVGIALCTLRLTVLTEWVHVGFGKPDRPLNWFTDAVVFGVAVVSAVIYWGPNVYLAGVSTYFSYATLIILLNVLLLERIFGEKASVGRSLLLFICNVAQITLMFATWYRLGGVSNPLLISILTLATIGYEPSMATIAMIQILTNFVLLAIFLSHLVGQIGQKRGSS
jgi:hypothetical protein